jgi:hypothetical protein
MSVKVRYLPQSDADRMVWLNNFASKLGIHATVLEISPAELSDVQKDAVCFQYILQLVELYKNTLPSLVSYKNLLRNASGQKQPGPPSLPVLPAPPPFVREGIFDRVSMLVKRIKASLHYSESIGLDLGIIAPVRAWNKAELKPLLRINLKGPLPNVKSSKGIATAMDLYADRNDGQGFVFVGRLTRAQYLDKTPLPAEAEFFEWKYKAIFVIADKQVGQMSNVVSVVLRKA